MTKLSLCELLSAYLFCTVQLWLIHFLSWIRRMHFLELYTEKHWTLLDVIFGTKNFLIFRFWKWCNLKVQDTIFWVWGSDFGHEDDWRWLNWQGIFPVQLLSLSHFTIPTVSKNMTQKKYHNAFFKEFLNNVKVLASLS